MMAFALTARLRPDRAAIDEYEALHSDVWPEVVADNVAAGVKALWIYRDGTQLVMVVHAADSFMLDAWGSFLSSPRTREWLDLTDPLLLPDPSSVLGASWRQLREICYLVP